jgi:mitogen-activated protein kinase binding protein 1
MHNIDNKSSSISKSYTNSKKEELLKVINEAKQKLENVSVRRRPLTHIQRVA